MNDYVLGPGSDRLTEPQMMRTVVDIAHTFGYELVYHTELSFRSKGTSKGFPDLCLIRRGDRMVFFEVKGSVKSKVANEQVDWVRMMRTAGVAAYIAFPRDLEVVATILSGKVAEPERGTGYCDPSLATLLRNETLAPGHREDQLQTDESGRVRPHSYHIG